VHVSAPDVSRKDSSLTPLAFSRLLEWLDDGADSHGERYLEMHRRLVSYFERRNRRAADELADETLRRIGGTLEQTGTIRTTPPARYCYVVARFVLLEDLRREPRHIQFDDARPVVAAQAVALAGSDSLTTDEQRLDCLDRGLQRLHADERELIVEYYRNAPRQAAEHRRRMAERMGISKNALGIRALRIRERLMTSVMSCRKEQR
jgi:DNA-directed RNA polymerase specialized sigma24 family protein